MSAFSPRQEDEIRRIATEVCNTMIKEVNLAVSIEADDLSPEAVNKMVDEVTKKIFDRRRA